MAENRTVTSKAAHALREGTLVGVNGGLVLSEITLSAVQAAAIAARIKHVEHSMLDEISDGDRLAILGEEFGEVARTLTYDAGTEAEREEERVVELLQLAAMALSWVEKIEGVRPQ